MSNFSIEHCKRALETGLQQSFIEEQRAKLSLERELVNRFLAEGGHAYGFSSFLGHLDSRHIRPDESILLFQNHLVGHSQPLTLSETRCIIYSKIAQLSSGHSGISVSMFDEIVDVFSDSKAASTDLLSSYGSGDVAAAALFWNSIIDPTNSNAKTCFQPGDTIALISGNFISVGLSLHWILTSLDKIDCIVDALSIQASNFRSFYGSSPQLPVSIRDLSPFLSFWTVSKSRLKSSVNSSLSKFSSNPLFSFSSDGSVDPVSNSTFLNFELSSSLDGMKRALCVLGAYQLGHIRFLSKVWEESTSNSLEKSRYVQVPKVGKSYYDSLLLILNTSPPDAQNESLTVEDLCDGSLKRVCQISEITRIIYSLDSLIKEFPCPPFD